MMIGNSQKKSEGPRRYSRGDQCSRFLEFPIVIVFSSFRTHSMPNLLVPEKNPPSMTSFPVDQTTDEEVRDEVVMTTVAMATKLMVTGASPRMERGSSVKSRLKQQQSQQLNVGSGLLKESRLKRATSVIEHQVLNVSSLSCQSLRVGDHGNHLHQSSSLTSSAQPM